MLEATGECMLELRQTLLLIGALLLVRFVQTVLEVELVPEERSYG